MTPIETALENPCGPDFTQHSHGADAVAEPADDHGLRRKPAPPTKHGCQVHKCNEPLPENDARYYKRFHICRKHANAPMLELDGQRVRFCQQCGRFQEVAEFDGERKSCRGSLEKHNARRRRKAGAKAAAAHGPYSIPPTTVTAAKQASDASLVTLALPPQHPLPSAAQQPLLAGLMTAPPGADAGASQQLPPDFFEGLAAFGAAPAGLVHGGWLPPFLQAVPAPAQAPPAAAAAAAAAAEAHQHQILLQLLERRQQLLHQQQLQERGLALLQAASAAAPPGYYPSPQPVAVQPQQPAPVAAHPIPLPPEPQQLSAAAATGAGLPGWEPQWLLPASRMLSLPNPPLSAFMGGQPAQQLDLPSAMSMPPLPASTQHLPNPQSHLVGALQQPGATQSPAQPLGKPPQQQLPPPQQQGQGARWLAAGPPCQPGWQPAAPAQGPPLQGGRALPPSAFQGLSQEPFPGTAEVARSVTPCPPPPPAILRGLALPTTSWLPASSLAAGMPGAQPAAAAEASAPGAVGPAAPTPLSQQLPFQSPQPQQQRVGVLKSEPTPAEAACPPCQQQAAFYGSSLEEQLERVSQRLFHVPAGKLAPHVREGVLHLMQQNPALIDQIISNRVHPQQLGHPGYMAAPAAQS